MKVRNKQSAKTVPDVSIMLVIDVKLVEILFLAPRDIVRTKLPIMAIGSFARPERK